LGFSPPFDRVASSFPSGVPPPSLFFFSFPFFSLKRHAAAHPTPAQTAGGLLLTGAFSFSPLTFFTPVAPRTGHVDPSYTRTSFLPSGSTAVLSSLSPFFFRVLVFKSLLLNLSVWPALHPSPLSGCPPFFHFFWGPFFFLVVTFFNVGSWSNGASPSIFPFFLSIGFLRWTITRRQQPTIPPPFFLGFPPPPR